MVSRGQILVAVVASVVVLALAVGLLLLLERGGSVELPDEAGGLQAQDAQDDLRGEDRQEARDNLQQAYDFNSHGFSEALDGVDVDTRTYGDEEFDRVYRVVAIAADAGPLLPVGFDDPDLTQTAAPMNEVVQGAGGKEDVDCLLIRQLVPLSEDEPTEEDLQPVAVVCQLISGGRTVRVNASNDPDVDDVVAFLVEVSDSLG